jgi:pimeloyl-ACP methyl ester carboxylesterase
MRSNLPVNTSSVRGLTRLALDAATQVTDIVESMHLNISHALLPWDKPAQGRTRGITGLVYWSIRNMFGGVREGLDQALSLVESEAEPLSATSKHEAFRAALNGVVGDHLAESGNPLALQMRFRRDGKSLELTREALRSALTGAGSRVLVMVHGLCMNDLQWRRNGHNHGAELARELGCTPVYLNYNSGRHISSNGREFAEQMEQLAQAWPVEITDLTVLAHSLGGLVTRSACHYGAQAGHSWLGQLRKIIFLGTPHHGAPLERGGNWFQTMVGITPYTAPLARLGMLRSAGVTDLRHGNLLDEDWRDHHRFEVQADTRQIVPLPAGVECYAAAATTGLRQGDIKDILLGDGLVPVNSGLGLHVTPEKTVCIPADNHRLYYDTNHWELLDKPEVYAQIKEWLA